MPEDVPDGWAFLQAHGFERTGEAADLLADIARFRPPERVLRRAGGGVRFDLAADRYAAEVIDLQERHFPNWNAFYEHQLTLPGTVLVARADGQVVGTCTVQGPAEYDFLWRALVPGAVGAPQLDVLIREQFGESLGTLAAQVWFPCQSPATRMRLGAAAAAPPLGT